MDFDKLVAVYGELEKTASGNQMREILSEFFKKVSAEEINVIAYLTLGRISSEFDDINLGMADQMVLKAIAVAGGRDETKVKKLSKEKGDLGLAAEEIIKTKGRTLVPVGTLTVKEVFEKLHKLAGAEGSGSQDAKISILASLLQKSSPQGAKYLCRIVLSTLRMGVGEMTVLDSLAIAFTGEKKNKEFLENAYNICPDVGIIAGTIASSGLKGINKIGIRVGRPIKMMLCQRVENIEDIKEHIEGKIAVEEKYDGERIQAHKSKDKIILFSRRMENITHQFPDIITELNQNISAKEFVIEGEAVAIGKKGEFLPFQTLMQRRRKYDIEKYVIDIPVRLHLFDVLYLNGESYLEESYLKRIKVLEKIIKPSKHLVQAKRVITDDIEEVEDFFNHALEEGCEGIIAKSTAEDSVYQAGTRGWLWIKWKRDYSSEMKDTVDLVVVGAFAGQGKRSGGYGALLCAVYNEKDDSFETVSKLGTGFTDEQLEELPKMLNKYKLNHKSARVNARKEMKPDVWFEPRLVVEVLAAEITQSPIHTAAFDGEKGLALRFPRFMKYREDKKAEQATTAKELEQMWRKKR